MSPTEDQLSGTFPDPTWLEEAIEAACGAAWDDSHLSYGEPGWSDALHSERAAYRNAMTAAIRAGVPVITRGVRGDARREVEEYQRSIEADVRRVTLTMAAEKLRLMCADPTDLLTAQPGDARMVINVSLWPDDEAQRVARQVTR